MPPPLPTMAAAAAAPPRHTASAAATAPAPPDRAVIVAASVGTVFEWYDFYLFGLLAGLLAQHFFGALEPGLRELVALAGFAAGFVVRPLGALVFGRLGDLVGRRWTLLATVLVSGLCSFLVAVLPGQAQIGAAAPVMLVLLRLVQGLALGGEYGGAALIVAEQAPPGRRGAHTAWVQLAACLGLLLALVVTLAVRSVLGEAAFADWGWRLPYALSLVLLGLALWLRLQLAETPAFARLKAQGRASRAPITESFGQWGNLRLVLLVLAGATAGQAVVWYTGHFYVLLFLQQALGVEGTSATLALAVALLLALPLYPLLGGWSDRIGRKPVVLAGCVLAACTTVPLFQGLTALAHPALAQAMAQAPVVLRAAPAQCGGLPGLAGTGGPASACDFVRQRLAQAGVSYRHQNDAGKAEPPVPGSVVLLVGTQVLTLADAQAGAAGSAGREARRGFDTALHAALRAAGWPEQAPPLPPGSARWWGVVGLLWLLGLWAAMVYAPLAAWLVELFPTRIRYTSLSLPYHLGNGWFGGLLPLLASALAAGTGSLYAGLWVTVGVAAASATIGALLLRETHRRALPEHDRAA